MSEEKRGEKSKSTLSADVPPFIPRSCNIDLLGNVLLQNGMNHIPQYLQDTAHTRESEWHVPFIPPASSGIMLYPMAPVLHPDYPDYQFQSSQENGYYIQTSNFPSAKKHFPSKVKKSNTLRYSEDKTEKTGSATSKTNANNDSFSESIHVSSENERRQKETSRYQSSKLKINFVRNNDKQESHVRIMTPHKSLNCSVKLDSNTEFPSLPSTSNKDKLFSQTCNSEPYQLVQHSSYSSILQSTPKPSPDVNHTPDVSDKNTLIVSRYKTINQQRMLGKQKAERIPGKRHGSHKNENRFDDTKENEQKYNLETTTDKKDHRLQTQRTQKTLPQHSIANAPKSIMERKEHIRNNKKNSPTIDTSTKEASGIMCQRYSRESTSKDLECVTKKWKYHESEKSGGTAINSPSKKNYQIDKEPSVQYSAKSNESGIGKKKYIEQNRKSNRIIDSPKVESWSIDQQKQSSLDATESTTKEKKDSENFQESNQVIIGHSEEESNVTGQLMKLQKSQKRKKQKRKKKKDILGKVSLLSPEVFANITNKMSKEQKINQSNTFNLCDQLDFPSLGFLPSTATATTSETENHNTNSVKSEILPESTSNSEKLSLSVPNIWKPAAYSDVLQTKKVKNKEVQKDANTTMKTPSQNEDTLVTASKKKERKKKKKDKGTSDDSKKSQTDSGKQNKCNSVIQISLSSMVTSLQQVKLNQMKKKEMKARVISTKRGIMDKLANPHNILDSSAPMKKRGKERERPGKKRLSAMRKIILREREKRRMQNLEAEKSKSEDEGDTDRQVDLNANVTSLSESSSGYYEPSSNKDAEQVDRKLQASKIVLHTRKFRDYCDHMISEEIDLTVLALLKDLIRFQDRLHEKDPIKARTKRRLVYGLREVTKHLRLCKLKCIIIAPNIENIPSEGGLSDALQVIIKLAQQQNIPYVFALQRHSLGKVCMKIVPVSCVGIFYYDGAEGHYHKLLEFLCEAREKYKETLKMISTFITEDIKAQLLQPNILPAAVQPIRSKVLSKLAMHNIFTEKPMPKDLKTEDDTGECLTDWNTGEVLQNVEFDFVVTESILESEKLCSEETVG